MHDLAVRAGHVVDPSNNIDGPADVGVHEGRIAEVGRITSGARQTIDVEGQFVLPGVIDTHTHLSNHFGSAEGHRMVAKTGVVTVLDLAGTFDDLATRSTRSARELALDRVRASTWPSFTH